MRCFDRRLLADNTSQMRLFASLRCQKTHFTCSSILSFSIKLFEALINNRCCFVHFVNLHLSSLGMLEVRECHFHSPTPKKIFPAWTQTSNSPATGLTLCPLGHSSCWKSLFSPGRSCSEQLVGPLSQNVKPLWQLLATESSSPAWVIEDHHMCDPTEHELCSHRLLLSFDRNLSLNLLCRPCLLTHWAEKWGWDYKKILSCCLFDIVR